MNNLHMAVIIFIAAILAQKHLGDYEAHYSYDGLGSYAPLFSILTYWLPFKPQFLIIINMLLTFYFPYVLISKLKTTNHAYLWLYSGASLIISALWYMPQMLALNLFLAGLVFYNNMWIFVYILSLLLIAHSTGPLLILALFGWWSYNARISKNIHK